MRFFAIACLFGIGIGLVGCATNNWSSSLFKNPANDSQMRAVTQERGLFQKGQPSERSAETEKAKLRDMFRMGNRTQSQTGIEPRARAIEKRLGL